MLTKGVGVFVSVPRRILSFSMLLVMVVLTSRVKGCWLDGILKLILTISLNNKQKNSNFQSNLIYKLYLLQTIIYILSLLELLLIL